MSTPIEYDGRDGVPLTRQQSAPRASMQPTLNTRASTTTPNQSHHQLPPSSSSSYQQPPNFRATSHPLVGTGNHHAFAAHLNATLTSPPSRNGTLRASTLSTSTNTGGSSSTVSSPSPNPPPNFDMFNIDLLRSMAEATENGYNPFNARGVVHPLVMRGSLNYGQYKSDEEAREAKERDEQRMRDKRAERHEEHKLISNVQPTHPLSPRLVVVPPSPHSTSSSPSPIQSPAPIPIQTPSPNPYGSSQAPMSSKSPSPAFGNGVVIANGHIMTNQTPQMIQLQQQHNGSNRNSPRNLTASNNGAGGGGNSSSSASTTNTPSPSSKGSNTETALGFAALIEAKKKKEAERAAAALKATQAVVCAGAHVKKRDDLPSHVRTPTKQGLSPKSASYTFRNRSSSVPEVIYPGPGGATHTPLAHPRSSMIMTSSNGHPVKLLSTITSPQQTPPKTPVLTALTTSNVIPGVLAPPILRAEVQALPKPSSKNGLVTPPQELANTTALVNHALITREQSTSASTAASNSSTEPEDESLALARKILAFYFGDDRRGVAVKPERSPTEDWSDQDKRRKTIQSKSEVNSVLRQLSTKRIHRRKDRPRRIKSIFSETDAVVNVTQHTAAAATPALTPMNGASQPGTAGIMEMSTTRGGQHRWRLESAGDAAGMHEQYLNVPGSARRDRDEAKERGTSPSSRGPTIKINTPTPGMSPLNKDIYPSGSELSDLSPSFSHSPASSSQQAGGAGNGDSTDDEDSEEGDEEGTNVVMVLWDEEDPMFVHAYGHDPTMVGQKQNTPSIEKQLLAQQLQQQEATPLVMLDEAAQERDEQQYRKGKYLEKQAMLAAQREKEQKEREAKEREQQLLIQQMQPAVSSPLPMHLHTHHGQQSTAMSSNNMQQLVQQSPQQQQHSQLRATIVRPRPAPIMEAHLFKEDVIGSANANGGGSAHSAAAAVSPPTSPFIHHSPSVHSASLSHKEPLSASVSRVGTGNGSVNKTPQAGFGGHGGDRRQSMPPISPSPSMTFNTPLFISGSASQSVQNTPSLASLVLSPNTPSILPQRTPISTTRPAMPARAAPPTPVSRSGSIIDTSRAGSFAFSSPSGGQQQAILTNINNPHLTSPTHANNGLASVTQSALNSALTSVAPSVVGSEAGSRSPTMNGFFPALSNGQVQYSAAALGPQQTRTPSVSTSRDHSGLASHPSFPSRGSVSASNSQPTSPVLGSFGSGARRASIGLPTSQSSIGAPGFDRQSTLSHQELTVGAASGPRPSIERQNTMPVLGTGNKHQGGVRDGVLGNIPPKAYALMGAPVHPGGKVSAKAYALMHGKTLRQQRPLQLSAMLRTNIGFRFLLVQCYREYSEENVLAFKAIESYNKHATLSGLQSFIQKYIEEGADLMINLSSHTRSGVKEFLLAYQQQDATVRNGGTIPPGSQLDLSQALIPAQKEILELLERDSFKRFMQSLLYVAYVSGAQPPTVLKRRSQTDQQDDMALIATVNSAMGQDVKAHLAAGKK